MIIKHLKHKEIDKLKWDEQIDKSQNATLYAQSWYLDIVCPGWEALVNEDFSIFMPLPIKLKYGFKYLTQPFYSQQLGVFTISELNKSDFYRFIESIPYKFYRLQLNKSNCFDFPKVDLKPNFVLKLNKPYDELQNAFGKNCKRNVKKSINENQSFVDNTSPEDFLKFVETNLAFKPIKGVMPILKLIIKESVSNGSAMIFSAIEKDSDKLLAAVFLISWKNSFYYLMPASSEKGKEYNSMFFIVDQLIQKHSETEKILDFEGSSIEGVARFYKGFGAESEYYPILNQNNLIFPLNKLLK